MPHADVRSAVVGEADEGRSECPESRDSSMNCGLRTLARIIHWTGAWRRVRAGSIPRAAAALRVGSLLPGDREGRRPPACAVARRAAVGCWRARGCAAGHAAAGAIAPKARATATKVAALGKAEGSWNVKRRTLCPTSAATLSSSKRKVSN